MDDKAGVDLRRGQLAARMLEETQDILDTQERKIINQVMMKLNGGEALEPQFAIQQWLELYSVQRFRRVLQQRERGVASSGSKFVQGAETLGGDPHEHRG